jgi:hypothetical protein
VKFIYLGKATIEKDGMESFILLAKKLRIQGLPNTADFSFPNTESPEKLGQLSLLPPEVLLKILQYVPTLDVLLNVARISKKFYDLSKDLSIHIRVSLPLRFPAIKFLESTSKIESLQIVTKENKYDFDPSCYQLLRAIPSHAKLREVVIVGTRVGVESLKYLIKTGIVSQLTKLVLSVRVVGSTLKQALRLLALGGKLKHLELTGVQSLNSKFVANLATNCNNLNTLKTDCIMTDKDCFAILEAKKSRLKHLEVEVKRDVKSFFQMSSSSCFKLKFALSVYSDVSHYHGLALPTVTSLVLNTAGQECQIYPTFAKACPNLKNLRLYSPSGLFDFRPIKDVIVKFEYLETLSLVIIAYSFDVLQLFDRGVGIKLNGLKHIEIESGFCAWLQARNQAQKMFKNIPSLIDIKFGGQLIVKTSEWVCRVA